MSMLKSKLRAGWVPMLWVAVFTLYASSRAVAEEDADATQSPPAVAESDNDATTAPDDKRFKLPPPEGAKRLSPEYDVWIDADKGIVIVDGEVSLRRGPLEMFSCTRHTKEHESIISANTRAFLVHAALLTLGAEPGEPVRFRPEFKPPSGTEIEIEVQWPDAEGKLKKARAQDWVHDVIRDRAMTFPFVFAGSGFWTDEETGRQFYQAERGDFICVSNFSTAMLDIPVESTQANEGLIFEAFTDRIPALGTPVRMILKPKLEKDGEPKRERPVAPAETP